MEKTVKKGEFLRDVDFSTAMLLQDFKGKKVTHVKCTTAGGTTGTAKLDKPVRLDMLGATFYRKGATLMVMPNGDLAWTFNEATFVPVQ